MPIKLRFVNKGEQKSSVWGEVMVVWVSLFCLLLSSTASAVKISPRTDEMKSFPCSECHNPVKIDRGRKYPLPDPHEKIEFKHNGDKIKSCYICHDKSNVERLILNDEVQTKVTFNESYKLCWQCHGKEKRDWLNGIHGKEVGRQKGDRYRYTCVKCHEAHHPKFKKMMSDPPPPRPKLGIPKKDH